MKNLNPIATCFSDIEEMVTSKKEENSRLDFKEKTSANSIDLSREDKKALGEGASGFANAEGGTLIIGVKTERSNGVDRAHSIVPIKDVSTVADRYRSYLTECVSPPVEGIEVSPLPNDEGDDGVILIEIPKGFARPHMSTAPGHHRFYRRAADRFMQMERYEVEEMFSLKTAPSLSLLLDYQSGGSLGGHAKTYIRFGLENRSRTTAKFPYVGIVRDAAAPRISEFGLDGNGGTLLRQVSSGVSEMTLFSGGSDIVIHPGQSLYVSRLEYLHSGDERMHRYWLVTSMHPHAVCEIEFVIGCEDIPQKRIRASFTQADLLNQQAPSITEISADKRGPEIGM